MNVFKSALILIAVVAGGNVFAQSFEALSTRNGKKNPFSDCIVDGFIRRTDVNPKFNAAYGGTTINVHIRRDQYGKGESRFHWENPTLGDLIYVLARAINKKDTKDGVQAYGSGFFGWFQSYWNVVATDRLLVSPGISYGDYIFSTTRADGKILEPSGYYFHVGPAIMASYLFTDNLWVDTYAHYDIGAGKAGKTASEPDNKYPKPHFFNVGATVRHAKTRLMGGVRLNTLIDRGTNKDGGMRLDVSAGFMF